MSLLFGAYTPIIPGGDQLEAVNALERCLDRRLDVVNTFRKWGGASGDFAKARISLEQAASQGRAPLITWEPVELDGTPGRFSLEAIAAGEHDGYIRTWAEGLRDLGARVYLRPMHEFNLDPAQDSSYYHWGGRPQLYVRAWWRIRNVFNYAGAHNVKFVWCANCSDQPPGNYLERYWPGRAGVDVLGIDGYNAYAGWKEWPDIFAGPYSRLAAKAPDLPIWICETACAEPAEVSGGQGHSKAEWIRGMFTALLWSGWFERVQALLWLHHTARYDWRVDSSDEALSTLRSQLALAPGYMPPPPPYVPPVPDRVRAEASGSDTVVSWRQVPSFARGYRIYLDGARRATVAKPSTAVTLLGVAPGTREITVSSYTEVTESARSAPAN